MKLFFVLLLIISLVSNVKSLYDSSTSGGESENVLDLKRNISQLIEARGYPVENHQAITPDGYILSIQRIPAGRYQNNPNPYGSNGKPAVILQHGVEDIGTSWVIQENVYQSLGFILADNGFDVWINNVRGTTYSNSSIYFDPSSRDFWAFSFDQMAQYDLPTVLNLVLETTGNKKVGYAGHSQGTTMAFIAMSNQTIAEKINLFIALAPVVRVTHCESKLLDVLAEFNIDILFEVLGGKSFLADTPFLQKYLPIICKNKPIYCQNSLALIMGWDEANINNTRLPVYMAHEPGGTSVQNVAHWAQATKYGYQKFDYGVIGNLAHYGQATPPKYNISDFKVPVVVYSGGQDYLADPTDVNWLIPQLTSLVHWKNIPSYSHLDFVWAEDAYLQVYDEAVQYLIKYANT
ncbi:hypothetical protein DICPUDRAFT_48065 [Dictyostelium purpureum]|uniref:Lipase n=1 Tax=Dictyostelium purpureum TaxID=5786 RepID=F0ZMM8_DICPU|nr:uncharacterized protein DICPUDRAFT_48065 [Dictyostelium purpureum]EGC34803.1 hypothetical protein DICPUDRAFT_48065 [Dictyostelium purpureum]|eukprot:XP_003288660.1 hypothetical protein DICPUDRAFT_48065 [Dictyostelium purpureum]